MKSIFITGSDTGCGKTRVAQALISTLCQRGERVAPMKPVASGADAVSGALRNADALALIEASGVDWPYERVNRYAFAPPIAPHLAAAETWTRIELPQLAEDFAWLSRQADRVIVEGVGGWAVPLGETATLSDLVQFLRLPVVMVVGLRLGCINHALLTARQILREGLPMLGWIACEIDPAMNRKSENIETLERLIPVPRIATLAHGEERLVIERVL